MAPWEIDFTMEGAYSELEINGGGGLFQEFQVASLGIRFSVDEENRTRIFRQSEVAR